MITRKTSYREDNLITLVHKFCVKEAAQLIGPLYGISEDEVEEPELLFDYELFAEVIQDKITATFNDKHLELFHAMLKMVRYLGNRDNCGEDGSENEPLFGVKKFAPVWEAMVDKIFGKLPQGVAKDKFNPHLRWNNNGKEENFEESEEEKVYYFHVENGEFKKDPVAKPNEEGTTTHTCTSDFAEMSVKDDGTVVFPTTTPSTP